MKTTKKTQKQQKYQKNTKKGEEGGEGGEEGGRLEQTAGSPPRTRHALERSELLNPMRANCGISAAH